MSDLAFAMLLVLLLCVVVLAGVFGVMYWTKIELGIDLFRDHLSDLLRFP